MPETYDVNKLVTLGELKQTAQVFKTESDKAIKYVAVSGNTISLFTTEDGSRSAAYTVDFPKDFLLDQARTLFVPSFTFSAATYPGAVNPSFDGKPVMVLAVKGTTDIANGTANDTINYSFMDMSALVDISNKADKPASATVDNLAAFDASKNPVDSGIAKSNVVLKSDIATTAEVTAMLTEVFGGSNS